MTPLSNQQINEILDKLYKKYKNKDFILSRDEVLQLARKKSIWLRSFWNLYYYYYEKYKRDFGSAGSLSTRGVFFALTEGLIFFKPVTKPISTSPFIFYEEESVNIINYYGKIDISEIGIKEKFESVKNILSSKLKKPESFKFIEELLNEIEVLLKENDGEVIAEYLVDSENARYDLTFKFVIKVLIDRLTVEKFNSKSNKVDECYSIHLDDIEEISVWEEFTFKIIYASYHEKLDIVLTGSPEPAKKLTALVELIKENKPKSKKEALSLMNSLNIKKSNFLDNFGKEFDKNNDGKLDLLEANIFSDVLNKNQKLIIDKNPDYVHKFIKLSKHIKSKSQNLQLFFERTQEFISENDELLVQESVDEIDFFKGLVNSYNLTVFHAVNMVASFVEGDLFVFYEIYETFDELNVFNSNWENEVAGKLSNIEDKLDTIISSIRIMEARIVNKLDGLQSSIENSFESLERSVNKQLETTNSMLGFNNLLTAVQTYQMYKINKNTRSLRP